MKSTRLHAALLGLSVAAFAPAVVAQVFVGSDNFNDNTLTAQIVNGSNLGLSQLPGQWRFRTDNADGAGNLWTETNQRMEWTTSSTSGFNRGQLGWATPVVSSNPTGSAGLSAQPYTSSWVASVEVTNNLTALPTGYSYTGFEIYTTNATNTGANAYYGIALNQSVNATWIVAEWGKWDSTLNGGAGGFAVTPTFIPVASRDASVQLRLSYDGSTQVLDTGYSLDGGATFLSGAAFALAGGQAGISAPYNNGFGLEFYASVNDLGSAVASGQMSFDNFSVSAVPEPSTYPALAGLGALGLVWWRRRVAAGAR